MNTFFRKNIIIILNGTEMGHNVFMIKGIKTYISKTELIRYSKHFKFDDICSHINEIQFTPSYRAGWNSSVILPDTTKSEKIENLKKREKTLYKGIELHIKAL